MRRLWCFSKGMRPRYVVGSAAQNELVVYVEPQFTGPIQALEYLSRSTHRIATPNIRVDFPKASTARERADRSRCAS